MQLLGWDTVGGGVSLENLCQVVIDFGFTGYPRADGGCQGSAPAAACLNLRPRQRSQLERPGLVHAPLPDEDRAGGRGDDIRQPAAERYAYPATDGHGNLGQMVGMQGGYVLLLLGLSLPGGLHHHPWSRDPNPAALANANAHWLDSQPYSNTHANPNANANPRRMDCQSNSDENGNPNPHADAHINYNFDAHCDPDWLDRQPDGDRDADKYPATDQYPIALHTTRGSPDADTLQSLSLIYPGSKNESPLHLHRRPGR